jgi:putative hydrolase of the HAD superfamily
MKYTHLFFDLDRTLWDFEKNSKEALTEMYNHFDLIKLGVPSADIFIEKYKVHNEHLWSLYRKGKIDKDSLRSYRFELCLNDFSISDDKLAADLGDMYVKTSPYKTNLFPFTHEVLKYLKTKYHLHIITNGFEEVQHIKLKQSKLDVYFDKVITSEHIGVKKPDSKIFNYALFSTKSELSQSLMLGDDFAVDILGAKNIGMDQVFFNPFNESFDGKPTFEISCLSELLRLL